MENFYLPGDFPFWYNYNELAKAGVSMYTHAFFEHKETGLDLSYGRGPQGGDGRPGEYPLHSCPKGTQRDARLSVRMQFILNRSVRIETCVNQWLLETGR
jgi:hypothetical protein